MVHMAEALVISCAAALVMLICCTTGHAKVFQALPHIYAYIQANVSRQMCSRSELQFQPAQWHQSFCPYHMQLGRILLPLFEAVLQHCESVLQHIESL